MHKRLLIASLVLFLFGLLLVWASSAGTSPNENLSTAIAMVIIVLGGLGLWFVAFIMLVLGLVLKEHKQQILQIPQQPQIYQGLRCPQCGKGLEESWIRCPYCGTNLAERRSNCPN